MTANSLKTRASKWLSSFLILTIFSLQIFEIPVLIRQADAGGSQVPNIVSILVSESNNSGDIKGRIKRYAADIQAALPNTRTVIVEVPDNAAPQNIAALNEKLFYEGDGNGLGKLVGTVLIGRLPIPVVRKWGSSFMSVYPYTDFDDKVFVYDSIKGLYEASSTPVLRDSPEIWHGVIMPNTGSDEANRTRIVNFLDKSHDFYAKQGAFANSRIEPSMLYIDLFHDQKASRLPDWKAYNLYLENLEDIAYNRFNKHLAQRLYDTYQKILDDSGDISSEDIKEFTGLSTAGTSDLSLKTTPDVQTRAIILKSVKQFFEVINEKHIGDILKYVYYTGRYGENSNIRADLAPVIIGKQDEFMKRALKDGNTVMESAIDAIVKNGLSRDIALSVSLEEWKAMSGSLVVLPGNSTSSSGIANNPNGADPSKYFNYYYGLRADKVVSAKDCSIVRWSSLPTEANRGYNVQNIQKDIDALTNGANPPNVGVPGALCFSGDIPQTRDTWGGNSPLNLDTGSDFTPAELSEIENSQDPKTLEKYASRADVDFKLKNNTYSGYIAPTFDLGGSKEFKPGDRGLQIQTPNDCLKTDLLADPYWYTITDTSEFGGNSSYTYYYPEATQGTRMACVMKGTGESPRWHKSYTVGSPTFSESLGNTSSTPTSLCTSTIIRLSGSPLYDIRIDASGRVEKKSVSPWYVSAPVCTRTESEGEIVDATVRYRTIDYKKIPSWIEHKSPTDEEYGAALRAKTTPSLAVDRDRYIDFISAKGTLSRIAYPNFYRLIWNTEEDLTAEKVRARVKELLDAKSTEINALISRENPSWLSGNEKASADLLVTGNYPSGNIDLFKLLEWNSNALGVLVDSILWYNERNATAKYAFVLEHHLDRDGNADYPISGHKSDYEIAYIGGPGDSANMYVKVDPAAKAPMEKSFAEIQRINASLTNLLDGANIGGFEDTQAEFKCGPPEGVPIWQWIPAIFCWLGTILPPSIGAGSCGPPLGGAAEQDRLFFASLDSDKDGIPDINTDSNKNGILDGYEMVRDGEILLNADLKRLGYRSATPLKATLKKDNRILAHDSFNEVEFSVKRIVAYDTKGVKKIVFARGGTGDLGSLATLQKYIGFTPIKVRAEGGIASYTISSKDNDLDVVLDARVSPKDKNGIIAFTKDSNEFTLEIRSENLIADSIADLTQSDPLRTGSSIFKAGEAKSIQYSFAVQSPIGKTKAEAPFEVRIVDDIDGRVLVPTTKISTENYTYSGELLKQAGIYRLEFFDTQGRFVAKTLTIESGDSVRLDAIASSSVFVKWQKATILVRSVDAFGNIVRWKIANYEASVSGGGYFVGSKTTKETKNSVDGTTTFEVSSNNGNETQKITIRSGTRETSLEVKSIDQAKISVSVSDAQSIIAGGTPRKVELKIVDRDGQIIEGFSGVASLDFPKNSGVISPAFVSLKGGISLTPITLTPKYVAGKDQKIDVQIPGISEISGNTITILPDAPMRVGISSEKSSLEANTQVSTSLTARLFDRYGNLAYNHPPSEATFFLSENSKKYARLSPEKSSFQDGVATSTLTPTKNPGTIYYAVTVSPGLEGNSFTIKDKSGASVVIRGVSTNMSVLESFYLWNKSKLEKTNYNALHTTLLGADYGNITSQDYLAGEILFAPESRSLSVTTLLNDTTKRSEVFALTPGGKLTQTTGGSLARLDIQDAGDHSIVSVYDPLVRENIGKLHLSLAADTPLYACENGSSIDSCNIEGSDKYILLQGVGAAKVTKGRSLGLSMDNVGVFEIDPRWVIKKYPGITLEIDTKQSKNLLGIRIKANNTPIGYLALKWNANQIVRTDGKGVSAALANNPRTLVYETISSRYATRESSIGNSSYGARGMILYDARSVSTQVDRNMIGGATKRGLEEYTTTQGIGFGEGNSGLLEFASGAPIGSAQMGYATYSMIQLGDPVVSLSKIQNTSSNFDRTLGVKIAGGPGSRIESYHKFDYNKDGQEDIIVFYDDGKAELLQNFNGTYRNLGYVVYVIDAGKERKAVGDFRGDGYSDIVMTDTKGRLIFLDNQSGKFVRIPVRINNLDGTEGSIKWAIMQLEVFDMDKDGKSDLVLSDDSGELAIYYGGSDSSGTLFTKKVLASDLALNLSDKPNSEGGAIRWNGIPELQNITQADYAREAALGPAASDALTAADQARILNAKLYYQEKTSRTIWSPTEARATRLSAAVGDDPANPGNPNTALTSLIQSGITTTTQLGANGSVNTAALDQATIDEYKTYLRSEYAYGKNIRVAKTYRDMNGGSLKAGDRIEVKVALSHSGANTLSDVTYLDSNPRQVFQPGENRNFSQINGAKTLTGVLSDITSGPFDLRFTNISLPPKETVTLTYELKANQVRFGNFKVGLLATDDTYGDVSMSANAVCGEAETLWKTIEPFPRTYTKILKEAPENGDTKNALGGRFTDFNLNGQSDYIDLLSGTGDQDSLASSLWDPTRSGVLVFRETVGTDGTLNSGNIEVGRIVANPEVGFVQRNAVSGAKDTPLLAPAGLVNPSVSTTEIRAGDPTIPEGTRCGVGNVITKDLTLVGWSQIFNKSDWSNATGEFTLAGRGTQTTLAPEGVSGGDTSCVIGMYQKSDPKWSESGAVGNGWKILTKSTFSHYMLASDMSSLSNTSGIPDNEFNRSNDLLSYSPSGWLQGSVDLSGMSESNVDAINSKIDDIVKGLGCGFGGGSCLALPMNWAPLAPGGAPVVFGYPVGPFTVDTGQPVFSSMNFRKVGKFCVPMPYPAASQGPGCFKDGAGGRLGSWSPTNNFRLFITPTITGSIGVAACFKWPAKIFGNIPPKWASPYIPGGNCIVAARPLSGCSDDGSDGAFEDLGTLDDGTFNAASCRAKKGNTTLSESDRQMIGSYLGGNTSLASNINQNAAGRGTFKLPSSPLLTLGWGSGGSNYELSIDINSIKNFEVGTIEKVSHSRVSAFPDFIMDWVNRQLEEVANKLTSLSTLYLIMPDTSGVFDGGWDGFPDKLEQAYAGEKNSGEKVAGSAEVGRTVSGVKSAYEFMSRLPILKFEKTTIDINLPLIPGEEEASKIKTELKGTIAQWQWEIASKKEAYGKLGTEGLDLSVIVQAEGLVGDLQANLQTIEDYSRFPEKLEKYLTWKERYANQVLCNINAIEQMLGGWIENNSKRFKAWAEMDKLLKEILKSWQLIPDLFTQYEAECSVCRNERADAKQFQFKLISATTPSIPIIKFPKWPDIILDLHNVRLGLKIAMPELRFTYTPIVLPSFPKLALPNIPRIGIGASLPNIKRLPSLSPLPDLPDIPSLPTITLPELPPPPTIPKLFGGIKFTLNILKIVKKIMCIMRSNPFIPEWRAGDTIAQITERQGKLGLDFMNIEFPQFNTSFIDAIKVTTYVNLEFQVDFLLEMARSTFEPFNAISADFSNIAGDIPQGNFDFKGLTPSDIKINVTPGTSMESHSLVKNYAKLLATSLKNTLAQWAREAREEVTLSEIKTSLRSELVAWHPVIGSPEFAAKAALEDGLSYDGSAEDEMIQSLKAEHTAKYRTIREAIASDIRATQSARARLKDLQKSVNSENILISTTETIIAESVTPDLAIYEKNTQEAYTRMTQEDISESEVFKAGEALRAKALTYSARADENTVQYAAEESTSQSQGAGVAEFIYRGIYTIDNGQRTRFFDYTNELDGSERAIRINRIKWGKEEFIYRVGNQLYLKERRSNERIPPVTESIPTRSMGDILSSQNTLVPTAPNSVREGAIDTGEINFSFRPARKTTDEIFRLEMVEYIDRYARFAQGETQKSISPATRIAYTDLFANLPGEEKENPKPGITLSKQKAIYSNGRGEATFTGPETRTLQKGETLTIGANKKIYTDSGGSRIIYRPLEGSTNTSSGILVVGASREIEFRESMRIEVLDGVMLLPDGQSTTRSINLASLKGTPVLLGSRIDIARDQSRLDIEYRNTAKLEINSAALYEALTLGDMSDSYRVSLERENAWYYARLGTVESTPTPRVNIRLLSPQKEADMEGPALRLEKGLRAPVYLEERIEMKDFVEDRSGIRDIYFDTDLQKDTNNDGIRNNDPDSTSENLFLRSGSTPTEFFVRAINRPQIIPIKIWATDSNGNISSADSKITIYAPIPEIGDIRSGVVQWSISESRAGEPIDIVRYRNGQITPLSQTAMTSTGGEFTLTGNTASGVSILRSTGAEIAKINESTGVITIIGSGVTSRVRPAGEKIPLQIQLVESNGSVLYSQSFALPKSTRIVDTPTNTSGALEPTLQVTLSSGYTLVRNASNTPTLPSGAYITSIDRKAIGALGTDGNIYLLSEKYTLSYRSEGGKVVIDIRDSGGVVASVMYSITSEYVTK